MDEEVCYGMVTAQAQFIGETKNCRLQNLQLEIISGGYGLKSELHSKPFAVIDNSTAGMIQCLDCPEFGSVRYQINQFSASANAFGNRSDLGRDENSFSITVNIYGLRSVMEDVGKAMAKIKAYLQQPYHVDPGVQYENPHYFKMPGHEKTPWVELDSEQNQTGDKDCRDEPFMHEILSNVLNCQLTRSDGLRELDQDPRIKTRLFRYQRQALDFIIQRESGVTVDAYSLWRFSEGSIPRYQNLVSGAWQYQIPQEPRGGIIADDVGLGKTLTMISAIAGSMDEALRFQSCIEVDSRPNAKSTLIVVPMILLDQWVEQIQLHTVEGSLTVHIYHGSGRVFSTTLLRDYDVVLTTYETISSDVSRWGDHSTLCAQNWFRIVLDEAHLIRNNKSKRFRAISSLSAQRRWCLTATPIQNSLHDIAALFEYLQVDPIHSQTLFKRHIVEPLKARGLRSDDTVGIRNLRLLLTTYCLRRQQSLLPQFIKENQDEIIRMVEFHADERQNYENLKTECNKTIKYAVCKKNVHGQAYFTVLQAILRLRLFCNHGLVDKTSVDLMDGTQCENCGAQLELLPGSGTPKSEFAPEYGLRHQVCVSCSPKGPMDPGIQREDVGREQRASQQCWQIFNEQGAGEGSGNSKEGLGIPAQSHLVSEGKRHASKIRALLEDIQKNPKNEKSIVFSSWVRSLELVEEALVFQGISCVRIDGKLNFKDRKKILLRFREDPHVLVLLMTTGTGAAGLNLTTASRVHLLEPQWNPMVEIQAIGRVARLGQSRRVTVYRYIMANTMEENVRTQQLKKKSLADIAIDMENFHEPKTKNRIIQRLMDLQSIL
ncbi:SNF2 family N-terminal domain-containing protein [Terfezia claveryi]|nr:SNF2 family N-terminal domain-containing protein [Terfezia claveryi]